MQVEDFLEINSDGFPERISLVVGTQAPKKVEIVSELPKTDSGKVDKKMLQMNAELSQSVLGSST